MRSIRSGRARVGVRIVLMPASSIATDTIVKTAIIALLSGTGTVLVRRRRHVVIA